MLVLSRKLGEGIRIGDDIKIVVGQIDEARVKLSIAAPPDVTIVRGELAETWTDDTQHARKHRHEH